MVFPLGKTINQGSSIKYVPSKLNLDTGKCTQCEEHYTISNFFIINSSYHHEMF